jgi:hypothetical protein
MALALSVPLQRYNGENQHGWAFESRRTKAEVGMQSGIGYGALQSSLGGCATVTQS